MTGPGQPVIVCPDCGSRSANPNDIREGYCGALPLVDLGPRTRGTPPRPTGYRQRRRTARRQAMMG